MKYSYLSNTQVSISKIGFGGGPLSGVDWGSFNKKKTMSSVCEAYDLGVNIFDTADVYGLGRSEKLLSQALGNKRNEVIISTKFGVNWAEDTYGGRAKTFYDCSPSRVVEALENSLRRLRIDSIPLYYVHWPDPRTPFADTAEALKRCQETGKIQNIGLSNFSLLQIREICRELKITAVQAQYSLIDREIEDEFLSTCKEFDISVFIYGSLAQGFLTGKYKENSQFGNDDCRAKLPHFRKEYFKQELPLFEKMSKISERSNVTMSQVALRWVLENPHVSCAISGIKSRAQIKENVSSLEFDIHPDDHDFFLSRS